jgi:membrane protease YdiL (CAAX protease family)
VTGWARWAAMPGLGAAGIGTLIATALFLGLAAFLEELLFRGYPFRVLAERFGARPAIVVTSAAFAAAHAANPGVGAVALGNTALAGILLGVLYWRTLSLWLVTGAHFGWNATLTLLADLPVSGIEMPAPGIRARLVGPEILTGGAYGPEGGLALLLVLLPAIGWALRSRRLRRAETGPDPNPLPGRRDR